MYLCACALQDRYQFQLPASLAGCTKLESLKVWGDQSPDKAEAYKVCACKAYCVFHPQRAFRLLSLLHHTLLRHLPTGMLRCCMPLSV